jgi:hypothetical protein
MTDQELMAKIKSDYGVAIKAACEPVGLPEAFLAALIANESGGNNDAKRFEPHVLVALWEVLLGRTTAYGSIRGPAVLQFVAGLESSQGQGTLVAPKSLPPDTYNRLDYLATSWGPTQIMGWHSLEPDSKVKTPPVLWGTWLAETVRLLGDFAKQFTIDWQNPEAFFRCWNGGHPTAATFDPKYVPNGLARMAIYQALLSPYTGAPAADVQHEL